MLVLGYSQTVKLKPVPIPRSKNLFTFPCFGARPIPSACVWFRLLLSETSQIPVTHQIGNLSDCCMMLITLKREKVD